MGTVVDVNGKDFFISVVFAGLDFGCCFFLSSLFLPIICALLYSIWVQWLMYISAIQYVGDANLNRLLYIDIS
jgi:hypothetical protein